MEWEMGNGKWGMGNWKWEMVNRKLKIGNWFFTLTFYIVESIFSVAIINTHVLFLKHSVQK